MKATRRHFSPEEKVSIIRQHLLEGKPVSELCEQLGIQVTLFYQWQKQFFENGAAAFARKVGRKGADPQEKKLQKLQEKVQQKNEVIAELLAEHVQLKKELGEL